MAMERMVQSKKTESIRPIVRIVSASTNPVGTMFSVWWGSRHKSKMNADVIEYLYSSKTEVRDREKYGIEIQQICEAYPEYAGEECDYKKVIHEIVHLILKADLPPSESILFTIEVDRASVAWREQLVRSRVAGYWTQTSRTFDLRSMDVNMSDSVSLLGGEEAVTIYKETVEIVRTAYERLMELGVPSEDIRLQPQSQVHRVYWFINLRQLLKILSKRSGWIAQGSLWIPVLAGICKELRGIGLFKIMNDLIGKPEVTLSKDEEGKIYVSDHPMTIENEDRYNQRDPQPCDPLWLAYKGLKMPSHTDRNFYNYLKSMFLEIWSDEYLEVLGWDRNNPMKPGPYDIV